MVPEKFFCCLGVELGAQIVGWVTLVILIVQALLEMIYWTEITTFDIGYVESEEFYVAMLCVAAMVLLYSLIGIIVNAYLLLGLYQKKYKLLTPWLIAIPLGFYFEMMFLLTVAGIYLNGTGLISLFIYLGLTIKTSITVHAWLCVLGIFKKYQNLSKQEDDESLHE